MGFWKNGSHFRWGFQGVVATSRSQGTVATAWLRHGPGVGGGGIIPGDPNPSPNITWQLNQVGIVL